MKKIFFLLAISIGNIINGQNIDTTYYLKYFVGLDALIVSAPVGIIFGTVTNKKVGFYLSLKTNSYLKGGNYYENISESKARYDFEDREVKETDVYYGGDIGITFPVSSSFFLFGGLGLYIKENIITFYDKYKILGEDGEYKVSGNKSTKMLSMILGTMFTIKDKYLINIGYHHNPIGGNFGFSIIL